MAVKLTEGTLVRNPETGDLVSLMAGGEIPAWAESLVGDHLKSETPAKRTTRAAK